MSTPVFKIDSNIMQTAEQFGGKLSNLYHEQLPFAQMLAINRSLSATRERIRWRLQGYFRHVSRYTMDSMFIVSAKKEDLTGVIGFKRTGAKYGNTTNSYLFPETEGDERPLTPFEVKLKLEGVIGEEELAPTKADESKMDAYGGLPASLYTQIMSGLQLFTQAGFIANRVRSARTGKFNPNTNFFAGVPRNHPKAFWAIWFRQGGSLVPILFKLKGKAHYRKQFPFNDIVNEEFSEIITNEWPRAWSDAIATAELK